MATTPIGFHYPALTDAPNGPGQIQQLATDLDTFLTPSVFRANGSASFSVSANTNIAFTVADDPLSAWNASTHLWTCPVAGRYMLSAQVRCGLSAAQPTCALVINGSLIQINSSGSSVAGANASVNIMRNGFILGDTVAIQSTAAFVMSTTGGTDNWLSLFRIGP